MAAVLVPLPLLLPLAVALLTALLMKQPGLQRFVATVGFGAMLLVSLALLSSVRAEGPLRMTFGGWPAPFGIEFVVDHLGAAMVVITAVMAVVTDLFSHSDADPAPRSATLLPLVFALLAAVGGAFVTGDLFNLYVWFELMLVASLGLLALGGQPRHLDATLKYFVLNVLGTLLLVLGIGYLYGITGHLAFGALRDGLFSQQARPLTPFIVAVVLALLVKAGAFPLFAWLPASYHTLPAPLLALFAGLLTKVGVYAVLRLLGGVLVTTPSVVYQGLGWVAALTMLVGVLGAAYHWDIRRILAFHIISQIGYMLLGVSLASAAGYAATLFYVLHHIVVKANLFLVGAIVCRLTGSYDLRRCGGLFIARPYLGVLFLIPALSLVGLPPLSGFWAKMLVLREAVHQQEYLFTIVALLVAFLTLYSMLKIWTEAFWKKHPKPCWEPPVDARLWPAYLATTVLALLTLAIGAFPEPLLVFSEQAATVLTNGSK